MTDNERKRLEATEDLVLLVHERLKHLENRARLMQREIGKLHTAYEGHQEDFRGDDGRGGGAG